MSIVFFDMDKTLLRVSSGTTYVKYLWKRGKVTTRELLYTGYISLQYSLGLLDFPKAMAELGKKVKDGSASQTKALQLQFFKDYLVYQIAPKALARAKEHLAQGDKVILLSASTQFTVQPVADYVHLPFRCTELEVVNDLVTGRIVGDHCYGEGKRLWAERIAQDYQVNLKNCTVYTDSISDRPIMEAVGKPIAVNPDRKLRALAQEKNWKVEMFY